MESHKFVAGRIGQVGPVGLSFARSYGGRAIKRKIKIKTRRKRLADSRWPVAAPFLDIPRAFATFSG